MSRLRPEGPLREVQMNSVNRDIFKAVHEGKWLSIEYKNREGQITKYWIGIREIHIASKTLLVDGLHLGTCERRELTIYIESILSSSLLEGTYQPVNEALLEDIALYPHKYRDIFQNVSNMKVLNYLADCNRLDSRQYCCEYTLVHKLDGESFLHSDGKTAVKVKPSTLLLTEEQFRDIVNYFQKKSQREKNEPVRRGSMMKQLALNLLSIPLKQGLYLLAYRRLRLDVKGRKLRPDDEITICREFTVNGMKLSIRKFLDAEDYGLLDDFERNAEQIKDRITQSNRQIRGVDDMPYVLGLGIDRLVDLDHEYKGILDMFEKGEETVPLKAFFGELLDRPRRSNKVHPLALLNRRVNLDQLLAIHNAVNNPLTYVQGPPGTGKTNTILNTIITAFFNGKTVLFCSYNNHPIDSVYEDLQNIRYHDKRIPFPMVRLGSNEKVGQALTFLRQVYEEAHTMQIFDKTLDRKKSTRTEQTRQLTTLLRNYGEILELRERREALLKVMEESRQFTFTVQLQGEQLPRLEEELQKKGRVSMEDARRLILDDSDEFLKYLYYKSAQYYKKLDEEKYQNLREILYMEKEEARLESFNKYLSSTGNLQLFLELFPIVATTCISAHRLGMPETVFDMVIMDESSQCNTAVALVPILRGKSLMLVGDPQQLNPVIVMDKKDNQILRRNYKVAKEYDYVENSIYKTLLSCDAISYEVLLSHHYRCSPSIIQFNNKKYYNNKLKIETSPHSDRPLVYVDVSDNHSRDKNTAPEEAELVLDLARKNRDKSIGIITPFVSQKEYISQLLQENGLNHVTCGTVHAFQGDEKDMVIFSTAITDRTYQGTYDWLKNNKELINVATSRAKEQLVVLSSSKNIERLHKDGEQDDLYELVNYVKTKGSSQVTGRFAPSRALGIKPYSTETEAAFLANLNHALDNIILNNRRCSVKKEVPISQVFSQNTACLDLFYTGRFDFVVYEKQGKGEYPILAIELDGKEHLEEAAVRARDEQKNRICRQEGFELIRIENSYARRYHYIKDILIRYFKSVRTV